MYQGPRGACAKAELQGQNERGEDNVSCPQQSLVCLQPGLLPKDNATQAWSQGTIPPG